MSEKLTKEELAAILNGREYLDEITREEQDKARAAGLVVVFGASDDLTEFRGAVYDEAGTSSGGKVRLSATGRVIDQNDDDENRIAAGWTPPKAVLTVTAEWCPDGFDGSWRMSADAPFATFDIMEDGALYCQGIVIDWAALTGDAHE